MKHGSRVGVRGRHLLFASFVAACSSGSGGRDAPEDLCTSTQVVAGGSVELGLGDDCAPVADGQVVDLVCGIQGLSMFLVNARVRDLDVNTSDRLGAITFTATGLDGKVLSGVLGGCRMREFENTGDGSMVLTTAYGLPMDPSTASDFEGLSIKISVEARDHLGHRVSDSRTVVAHVAPCAAR